MSAAADYLPKLLVWSLLATGVVLLLIASFRDIALRLLPNWAAVGVAAVGCVLRFGDHTLLPALCIAAILFLIGLALWWRGWLGGGDVKLLAACTLVVPPAHVADLIVMTTLGGGLLGILYLAAGHILARQDKRMTGHKGGLLQRLWSVERQRILRRYPLPYGCAISGAAVILMLGASGPLGN